MMSRDLERSVHRVPASVHIVLKPVGLSTLVNQVVDLGNALRTEAAIFACFGSVGAALGGPYRIAISVEVCDIKCS